MENSITIKFTNEEQRNVFMKWFIDWGFDELCQNDMVQDDLSQDDYYGELEHIPGGFNIKGE